MGRTIDLDLAIDAIAIHKKALLGEADGSSAFTNGYALAYRHICELISALPSAQPEKCSDILEELKDDDYYNYIHTGYSRFSEDDWDYLIHNAKEKEKLHERLDKQAGGD